MLTLIHNNGIVCNARTMRVDRKFHEGMLNYVEHLRVPITTVHPLCEPHATVMDPVELAFDDLPYRVLGLHVDRRGAADAIGRDALRAEIRRSQVVVGYGYGAPAMSIEAGKRLIACLEYDLETQITMARSAVSNPARSLWKVAKVLQEWHREVVPALRGSFEVHCNGYPMFRAAEPHNARRLLYLDSRMSRDLVIDNAHLETRLRERAQRRVRLLFSGRYEPIKGALDAVKTARKCLERGLNVEMDTYGQGSLVDEMRAIALGSEGLIRVHDAIPFPELVRSSREADLFVCCHVQSDPSCTYLETLGSGLPIVGYGNRMWSAMAAESGAGVVTARLTPEAAADAVQGLIADPAALDEGSRCARRFALDHCFEVEFKRRTDAINAALSGE
jgi:colanic acid/amylovoran biosynthesis glycosyltransferase